MHVDEHVLTTVAIFPTRGDAEIARALLDDAGLDVLVQAENEGGLNPGFYRDYGVRVVVRSSDSDEAVAILGEAAE